MKNGSQMATVLISYFVFVVLNLDSLRASKVP